MGIHSYAQCCVVSKLKFHWNLVWPSPVWQRLTLTKTPLSNKDMKNIRTKTWGSFIMIAQIVLKQVYYSHLNNVKCQCHYSTRNSLHKELSRLQPNLPNNRFINCHLCMTINSLMFFIKFHLAVSDILSVECILLSCELLWTCFHSFLFTRTAPFA